jgi:glycosyltransferase involved in cell wall biosynthesis
MTPDISVIVSTHNPNPSRFARTLEGILAQTLPLHQWELILVDNASTTPLILAELGVTLSDNVTIVHEHRLGLMFGRLGGFRRSRADILIFVDDDNVLAPDYLQNALSIFQRLPRLGLAGGKSIPEWEAGAPPAWVKEFYGNLALRDLGDRELISAMTDPPTYPVDSPIGAGMVARRHAVKPWMDACSSSKDPPTGRRGHELSSGEDCDIVMFALGAGWQVGYFPTLALVHLIPAARVTCKYLARLNHGIAKSWVQVLARHGIIPWPRANPWLVPIRKARAYLHYRAWAGPVEFVRWKGACGVFEGRAMLGLGFEDKRDVHLRTNL